MSHEKKANSQAEVSIGAFFFDPETHEIRDEEGGVVRMRKQSADVLAVLVEADGKVVEKATLFERVWQDVVTTDDSLVQCISDIRKTLGQDVVETFPKRGYRLSVGEPKTGEEQPKRRNPRSLAMLAAILFVVLGLAWSILPLRSTKTIMPPSVSAENTLAVLPFVDLNPDEELTYLSNGLSEDIATELSKIPGLIVIAPASSFDFRDAESGFQTIAGDLGARHLVRGTVRNEGNQVRINVSLIDPELGSNLWSERFDRRLENVLGLQDEVAKHVAKALSLALEGKDAPPERIEPDAYFMLLRGLEVLRDAPPNALKEARVHFENAILLDPQYARAHASLALSYGREAAEQDPADETARALVEKGLGAAVLAIQIDPNLPHAYLALGMLNLAIREYDNALAAARHSLRQDANFSDAYALLAEVGLFGANLDEALYAIQRAKLLHPHHGSSYDHIEGTILFHLGQFEAAVPLLQSTETEASTATLIAAYGFLGKLEEIEKLLQRTGLSLDILHKAANAAPYRFEERQGRLIEGLELANSLE